MKKKENTIFRHNIKLLKQKIKIKFVIENNISIKFHRIMNINFMKLNLSLKCCCFLWYINALKIKCVYTNVKLLTFMYGSYFMLISRVLIKNSFE